MSWSPLRLPPVDGWHAPFTGWTRAHWEAVADHLLAAVGRYATPGFAQYRLPGRPSRAGVHSDGLQGFARSFLLAACRIAGAGGAPADLIERYAAGLRHATDPRHRYAWPALADCSQQLVEAASIALALHETRPWLFDRLESADRERVVAWLAGIRANAPGTATGCCSRWWCSNSWQPSAGRTTRPRSSPGWTGSSGGMSGTAGTPTATARASTTTPGGPCTCTRHCGRAWPATPSAASGTGSGYEDPHYLRLGYASHAGPEVGEAARLRVVDGHLAVIDPDGTVSRRRRIERIGVHDRFAASAYEVELPAGPVRVATASIVRGPWELRVHRVTAPAGATVRDGRYAVAEGHPPQVDDGDGWACARRADGLTSAVVALHGFTTGAAARAVAASAFGACSATPYLTATDHPGGSALYVSLVVLTGDRVAAATLRGLLAVEVDRDQVRVTFPDAERVEVSLGAHPAYTRHPVDAAAVIRWPA